ncbi:hypothetical protein ACQE98_01260 [Ornithinimicrobium sp. W1679]|uniref:hypothetical protein n=1 Tax=Ornithinimicrobium sp. W1679 TaxID=3418770 RepID=UPI003CF746C9
MRPWLTASAATLVAALVTGVSVAVDVVGSPAVDEVGPVDAVYVIGPVETRIEEALAVMDRGVAPVLLATTSVHPGTGEHYATDHCGLRTATYRVECVLPDPYSTRGEARILGDRAAGHGWSRVAVMTSAPHAGRTRLLMERCTDAEVLLWTTDAATDRSLRGRVRAGLYQSAAWVKTQVLRGC